jgi:hypothetical protein
MTPKAPRPVALQGQTMAMETHCGKIYVTVNRDPMTGRPVEIFCRFGKAGGCGSAVMDGMTRMISYGLRSGMDADQVVRGLSGIACHQGDRTCMNALAEAVGMVMSGNG